MNESFTVLNTILKLQELPLHQKNCSIFFNFTVVPPPVCVLHIHLHTYAFIYIQYCWICALNRVEYHCCDWCYVYMLIENCHTRRDIKTWKTYWHFTLVFLQVAHIWIHWRFRNRNGISTTWWSPVENICRGMFYMPKRKIQLICDWICKNLA